jgi:hypothetical protein
MRILLDGETSDTTLKIYKSWKVAPVKAVDFSAIEVCIYTSSPLTLSAVRDVFSLTPSRRRLVPALLISQPAKAKEVRLQFSL